MNIVIALIPVLVTAEPQVATSLPLSEAVASGQPRVHVSTSGTLDAPLVLQPNQQLVCAPGVTITCRWGTPGDCITLADGSSVVDCTIKGEWTGDASASATAMHGIACRGSQNIEVRNVMASGFRGDGCYVGALLPERRPCAGKVMGSTFDHNFRNGVSVVCGRVVITDSKFLDNGQSGGSPQCGIDIEPNAPADTIDVELRNCQSNKNKGSAYMVNLERSTVATPPIRIILDGSTAAQFMGWGWMRIKGIVDANGFPRDTLPKTFFSVNGFEVVNK